MVQRISFFQILQLLGMSTLGTHAQTALGNGSITMPPGETVQSARAAGMAGAGIGLADDWSAIFVNPAGIGNQDDAKTTLRGLEIPNFTVGANRASVRLMQTYTRAQESGVSEVERELAANDNDLLFARATVFPYLTVRRFQLGILLDGHIIGYRSEKNSTTASGEKVSGRIATQERSQAAAVFGFSIPYLNSGSSFGVTARYGVRTSSFSSATIVDGEAHREGSSLVSETNRTRGLAVDLGLILRSKNPKVPILGVTLRDLGGSYYRSLTDKDRPEVDRTNVSTALTFDPFAGPHGRFRLLATVEGHHLNDGRIHDDQKLRLGAEARVGSTGEQAPLAVRVGHNLSGFSYGASLDAYFLKLEFGSLVETVDGRDGEKPDRRNFARLALDLRL
jgi:hypothetical protein